MRRWLHELAPELCIGIVLVFAVVSYASEWIARWLLKGEYP